MQATREITKDELLADYARWDVRYFLTFDSLIVPYRDESVDDDGHYLESRVEPELNGDVFKGVKIQIAKGTPKAEALKLIAKLRTFVEQTDDENFDFEVRKLVSESNQDLPF